MAEIHRDLFVLISIAKIDASLNDRRKELRRLPDQVSKIKKSIEDIEARDRVAQGNVDEMSKERRELEQHLEDNYEKIKKFKVQLMEVKTNKEYTAMLHEIEHVEKDVEAKEERLLVLMDELDQETEQSKTLMENGRDKTADLKRQQSELESRIKTLETDIVKLEAEKPNLLAELDPQLKKKYERILAKLNDYAVTNVLDETCQGCFARIPPQVTIEVKRNERLITCQTCGRLLVHYIA